MKNNSEISVNSLALETSQTASSAGPEMVEIYASPTDAFGVLRRPRMLHRLRFHQHRVLSATDDIAISPCDATSDNFNRSTHAHSEIRRYGVVFPDSSISPLSSTPASILPLANRGIRVSYDAAGAPGNSTFPVRTTSRTLLSQNKLFGVLDGVTGPRSRKRDWAKNVMNKAKAKIERISNSQHVRDDMLDHEKAISLDAPTQARLYAELELMITMTTNNYLNNELKGSRINKKSLVKIAERWIKSGRIKPIDFMFDLETQLAIVRANSSTLRFHGPAQGDYLRINATLAGWSTTVTKLNHRTLCNPDMEIRKYFDDILDMLELLGVQEHTFVKLQHLQAAAVGEMME
ncbi:hypothetical protein MMC11_006780 [Xylographa trunciseda]|nr:hypothetical protein [Xylographa trunciseda]